MVTEEAGATASPPPPPTSRGHIIGVDGGGGSIPKIERGVTRILQKKNIILVPTTERGAWFYTKFVRSP